MIFEESDQSESAMTGHGQSFFRNCTPGYYNGESQMVMGKTLAAQFGAGASGTAVRFFEVLRLQRDEGRAFENYDVE